MFYLEDLYKMNNFKLSVYRILVTSKVRNCTSNWWKNLLTVRNFKKNSIKFLGIKRNPFSLNTCLIEVILKAMISSNWSGERGVDTSIPFSLQTFTTSKAIRKSCSKESLKGLKTFRYCMQMELELMV